MNELAPVASGRAALDRLRIASDRLTASDDGVLLIDGVDARALVTEFGSPLVVTVEATILDNYRRIEAAFARCWPAPVDVLYSFKSNNTLAIRALLSRAGAGGDCFGEAELDATLAMGTAPEKVALNGSDKSAALVAKAVAAGVTINIDGEEEIAAIEAAWQPGQPRARVNLRLKVLPEALGPFMGGSGAKHGPGIESVRRAKWGFTHAAALPLLKRLLHSPAIEMQGFHVHVGHLSSDPRAFAALTGGFGEAVMELHRETGFVPKLLDIGGGWAREREPEQRGAAIVNAPIEEQAEAALAALAASLAGLPRMPRLWVEPGRYIVGNGQLILASVGAIKQDAGLRWLHVDASTNNLQRIETGGFVHDILPATALDAPYADICQIVGGTCFRSVIASDRPFPELRRGDLVAILDTGMYAEVFANQFNAVPRPASVLIGRDGRAEIIRRRETAVDIFALHEIPDRLRTITGASP
uniref:Diaminopimelate decarboxylase n=1 Tax=Bosea sp. NBC_00436 TaxID=2969620 RepID=A0A9E8CTB8_9HYPH